MSRLPEAILCSAVLGCATLGPSVGGEGEVRTAGAPGPSATYCPVRFEGEWVCAGPQELRACWLREEFERIRPAVLSWCDGPASVPASAPPALAAAPR